jgi:hypothetical protein
MDYPPGFPDRFRPIAEFAILSAEHKSKRSSVQQLIKAKLFAFAEVACSAAEAKAWEPESALSGLTNFIGALCEADSELIDSEMKRRLRRASRFVFSTEPAKPEVARQRRFERFKQDITREITSSREWLCHIERLAKATKGEQARKTESTAPGEQSQGIRVERRTLVDNFIAAVLKSTGRKINRKDIWIVAGYSDATEFQRFQRHDTRTTSSAVANFSRVLNMDPETFLKVLDRKQGES